MSPCYPFQLITLIRRCYSFGPIHRLIFAPSQNLNPDSTLTKLKHPNLPKIVRKVTSWVDVFQQKISKSSAILLSFPSKIISHHLCIIGFHSFSTCSTSFFPSKIPQPPSAYRPPAGLRSILPPKALRSQPCAARRPVANPRPF